MGIYVTLNFNVNDSQELMEPVEKLRRILAHAKDIAIVGLSDKPYRPSYFAAKYLIEHQYNVIPVTPMCDEILGKKCYPTLGDIPFPVDIVDCFRRSEEMQAIAADAVSINAPVLWMQLGVVNLKAKQQAEAAGLEVVMDRCTKIEHARIFGGLNFAGVNTGIISSKRPQHVR